jgi:modulator of FtsH protease HflK
MAWNEPGGGRDPWSQGPGGKRPGEQPPDLMELFRKLRGRWSGRGRGPGSSVVGLVAALLGLTWLLFGFYTVDEQDRAAVIRFGAYAYTEGGGLHWHWPPPIEHVKRINVTNPRQASVMGEMLTKDLNLVEAGLTVQFRIASAEDYLFNVDRPDDLLSAAARSALEDVVATCTIDEVLSVGNQAAIAARARDQLQQILDRYHTGLQVTDASLSKAEPPDEVKAAFADAMKAAEDQKRVQNEAQADASDRLPKARADAAKQIDEARAFRDAAIARAEGDTARFSALLAEYKKAPQVTRERLYLETMSAIYANSSKALVDLDKGNPSFTLPLEQMLRDQSKDAAPAAAAAPDAAGADDGARQRAGESR